MSYGPITSLSSFPHLCFLTTLLFLLSPAHAVRASVLKLLSWPIVWLGSLSAILTSSITDLLHSELCSAGFLFTLGRTEPQTPVLKFSCGCVCILNTCWYLECYIFISLPLIKHELHEAETLSFLL